MNLSRKWLNEFVNVTASDKEFAEAMTLSGSKVEVTVDTGAEITNVVVGKVVSIKRHENSDHMWVCMIDVGAGEPTQIVTGAQNVKEGDLVPVALHKSTLPGGIKIEKGKLRGEISNGMLCSFKELGLDNRDFPAAFEDGIWILSDDEELTGLKVGQDIREAVGLDDHVVEFEITPNRPDCLSVIGLAREAAATFDKELCLHTPVVKGGAEGDLNKLLTVETPDPELCPRYSARMVRNVKIAPSPKWMRERLRAMGVRPINNIVDITNYVMLALGQPTHVFDADNISDGITVRRANSGEELLLLNGKSLELSADDLVIADSECAVALAGVMGGAKDSVLDTTKNVILEVANFESTGVRRTALRYDNRTEASSRYEKAVDPERCDLALSMTMQLFSELYPEVSVTAFTDKYEKKLVQKEIDVEITWLERRLGKKISNEDVKAKLSLLGFEVSFTDTSMHITVPTWRSTGDVGIKADIMEEVARMYGYENFEPTPIVTSFEGAINQLEVDLVRKIKEYLAIRCNMQEVFTYPWMQDELVAAIIGDTAGVLKLSTPPSPTESYIRSTLLPNICGAVAKNERYYGEFAIFEEAQIFKDENYSSPYDARELLPTQERHVAGAVAGDANKVKDIFLRAKGIVENMSRYTHMEGFTFKREQKPSWAEETVWLNIYLGEEKIGDLALLSKKASLACGIKNLATVLFEINTDALKPFRSRTNGYARVNEYPLIEYDVSMLFDVNTKWADIKSVALKKKNNESFLKDVAFVDEYKGAQVPEGMKSVTIRLTIGSNEKTLNANEIEACANSVLKVLSKELGGEMRTK